MIYTQLDMVVYEWTDSMEKTLDIIRQNTVKLGENSIENYNALKMRIHYLQLPLAILSAGNSFAAIDLEQSFPGKCVSIACCVVSASLAGYLTYDWYVDSQKQMEQDFSFHKDSLDICKQIKEVLSSPRYDRQIDGAIFLRDTFKKYKDLIATHKLIAQYKGDVTIEENSLCENEEDMEGFVIDNWNIIFRPTLRRFKKKNMELIENVKKGGRSIRELVEPVVVPNPNGEVLADLFHWLTVRKKEVQTTDAVEDPEVRNENTDTQDIGNDVAPTEDIENQRDEIVKEGQVNFSEVYTMQETISSVYPKKEIKKSFNINFMEKI
jgi:hypothetical protein